MKKLWQAQISASLWLPWSQAFVLWFFLPYSSNTLLLIFFLHLAEPPETKSHFLISCTEGVAMKPWQPRKAEKSLGLDTPVKHGVGCEEEAGAAWKPKPSLCTSAFSTFGRDPQVCWALAGSQGLSMSLGPAPHTLASCAPQKCCLWSIGMIKAMPVISEMQVPFSSLFQ